MRKYLKEDKEFKKDFMCGSLKSLQEIRCREDCSKEVAEAINNLQYINRWLNIIVFPVGHGLFGYRQFFCKFHLIHAVRKTKFFNL